MMKVIGTEIRVWSDHDHSDSLTTVFDSMRECVNTYRSDFFGYSDDIKKVIFSEADHDKWLTSLLMSDTGDATYVWSATCQMIGFIN